MISRYKIVNFEVNEIYPFSRKFWSIKEALFWPYMKEHKACYSQFKQEQFTAVIYTKGWRRFLAGNNRELILSTKFSQNTKSSKSVGIDENTITDKTISTAKNSDADN